MPKPRRIGVILAAGRGTRLGGKKQLKPWQSPDGEKPLIAAAYDAIRPICDDMIVVLGHAVDEVATALGERPFHRLESNSDAPMFASIRAGLLAAQRLDATAHIVLHPGDHPVVAPGTLHTLTDCALQRPVTAIIPQYADRGGHPVLIPPTIVKHILNTDCPNGLGQFWLDRPELCHRIAINDPGVIRDIDTPADLP